MARSGQAVLTEQMIKALSCAPGERKALKDPTTPGLELRASATAKSWSMLYVSPTTKTRSRVTLGRYPSLTLAAARKSARTYRVELDVGRDPRRSQELAKRKAGGGMTFDALCDGWLADHAEGKKRASSVAIDRANLKRADGPRDRWGTIGVDSLTRSEVVEFLEVIKERGPVQANRVQAIFRWGVNRGHTSINPITGLDRIGGKEESKERELDDTELAIVWRELNNDKSPNGPIIRAALRFILLTCSRATEACEMPRAELQGLGTNSPLWRLPAERAKNKRGVTIPLSPLAAEQIEAADAYVLAIRPEPTAIVFPAVGVLDSPTSRYAAASACADICARTGVAKFTPHDLRRTSTGLLQRLGVPMEVIKWCLNHKFKDVTGRYAKYDYLKERQAALNKLAAHVGAIALSV
jgi:integrase